MEKFELCYEFYDHPGQFLVPEFLGKEQPDLSAFEAVEALRFEYRYNILPEGLVPRFIVRARALNQGLPRWRGGVVLRFGACTAVVKSDVQDRRVAIAVMGEPAESRQLLAVIRSDFEAIHGSIARLQVKEMVPVSRYPGTVLPYDKLLKLQTAGETRYTDVIGDEVVGHDVGALLRSIEDPPSVRRQRRDAGDSVRVVFSYAYADTGLRDRLETHLKLLQRTAGIETWHGRKMMPGARWVEEIDNEFKSADLILILVSADFFRSDYCYEVELQAALERYQSGQADVIPVILRPCQWNTCWLGKLQALPADGKPVTNWRNRDEAWRSVADGIARAARAILAGKRAKERSP
jgi:internalin A